MPPIAPGNGTWDDFGDIPIGDSRVLFTGNPEEQVSSPYIDNVNTGFRTWGGVVPREGNYQIEDILGQDYSEEALQDLLNSFKNLLRDEDNKKKEMLETEIEYRRIQMNENAPVFSFEGKRF